METKIASSQPNGTTAYRAKIILKRDGRIVHRELPTPDRKIAARARIKLWEQMAKARMG